MVVARATVVARTSVLAVTAVVVTLAMLGFVLSSAWNVALDAAATVAATALVVA